MRTSDHEAALAMATHHNGRKRDGPGTARERGQSLVEFALVLPMLLVVLFGVLEFGFVISDQIVLANAARDGARVYSLEGGDQSDAVSQAQSDLSSGGLISCSAGTPLATSSGSSPVTVTVKVQCTYTPVTPLGSLVALLGRTLNTLPPLSRSTSMRQEQ